MEFPGTALGEVPVCGVAVVEPAWPVLLPAWLEVGFCPALGVLVVGLASPVVPLACGNAKPEFSATTTSLP